MFVSGSHRLAHASSDRPASAQAYAEIVAPAHVEPMSDIDSLARLAQLPLSAVLALPDSPVKLDFPDLSIPAELPLLTSHFARDLNWSLPPASLSLRDLTSVQQPPATRGTPWPVEPAACQEAKIYVDVLSLERSAPFQPMTEPTSKDAFARYGDDGREARAPLLNLKPDRYGFFSTETEDGSGAAQSSGGTAAGGSSSSSSGGGASSAGSGGGGTSTAAATMMMVMGSSSSNLIGSSGSSGTAGSGSSGSGGGGGAASGGGLQGPGGGASTSSGGGGGGAVSSKSSVEYWSKTLNNWPQLSELMRRKAKEKIRKGVPDKFRAMLWKRLLDCAELQREQPDLYEQLSRQHTSFAEQITRDLSRTLPNHVFFQQGGLGVRALFNVLNAYAAHRPAIGYCQGMGFIVAILLLHMPEEDAFFCFLRLCDDYRLSGLFEPGFPMLYRFFWIQDRLTEQLLPSVYMHLRKIDIMTDSFSTQFYTTLFVTSLPYEYVLRIWDSFLGEGACALFRATLAIFKLSQDQLLKSDFESTFSYFRSLSKRHTIPFTPDELVRQMSEFKVITASRIEKLERKYLDSTN